ncbi:MAG: hypothetical protein WDO73_00790 [Ignavibacteriota bacterium]
MPRAFLPLLVLFFARCFAFQAPVTAEANHVEDPFALGWMLVDTNGDGIADSINGKVVVDVNPSSAIIPRPPISPHGWLTEVPDSRRRSWW